MKSRDVGAPGGSVAPRKRRIIVPPGPGKGRDLGETGVSLGVVMSGGQRSEVPSVDDAAVGDRMEEIADAGVDTRGRDKDGPGTSARGHCACRGAGHWGPGLFADDNAFVIKRPCRPQRTVCRVFDRNAHRPQVLHVVIAVVREAQRHHLSAAGLIGASAVKLGVKVGKKPGQAIRPTHPEPAAPLGLLSHVPGLLVWVDVCPEPRIKAGRLGVVRVGLAATAIVIVVVVTIVVDVVMLAEWVGAHVLIAVEPFAAAFHGVEDVLRGGGAAGAIVARGGWCIRRQERVGRRFLLVDELLLGSHSDFEAFSR